MPVFSPLRMRAPGWGVWALGLLVLLSGPQSEAQGTGDVPAALEFAPPVAPKTLASQALDRLRFERSDALAFDQSNFITTHLLDRHGFVWMASEGNLFRFDGYTLRTYGPDPADPNSLPSDVIYGLAEAPDGRLWLAAVPESLIRFDPVTEKAETFDTPLAIRNRRVAVDSTGLVWFISQPVDEAVPGHRLYRLDPATGHSEVVPLDAPDGLLVSIVDMEASADGHLWLATTEYGAIRYDVYARQAHFYDAGRGLDTPIARVRVSASGAVWAQGDGSLYEYDAAADRFTRRLTGPLLDWRPNPFLSGCYVDALRVAWCYRVDDGTLAVLDVDTGAERVFTYDPADLDGIPGMGIGRVFEDQAGVLWIAGLGGVRRVTGRQGYFTRINNAPTTFLRAGTGRDGSLLVAEFCGDVFRLEGTLLVPHPLVPLGLGLCAMTVTETTDGAVWVGTWPWQAGQGGVYRFDPDGTYRYFVHDDEDPTSIAMRGVRAILEDRTGRIWIGTSSTLDLYDPATQTFSRAPTVGDGFAGDDVWALAEAPDGTLWVSYYADGVEHYDPATGRVLARYQHDRTDPATLGADVASWIEPSRQDTNTVWIATWGGGLNRLDLNSGLMKRLTPRNGLPDLQVNQVLEDDRGRIWATTPRGLVRHDPATGALRVFGQADGLRAYAGLAGFSRLGDGRFALTDGRTFEGNGQLFVFHPDSIRDDATTAPLALTALDVQGQARPIAPQPDELRFAPADEVFGLEFAALNYADAERIRYRHRLDGFDSDWIEVGTRRYAAYTNLPPGRYTFRLQADLGAGWGGTFAVPVVVEPYWWETAWARLSALLSAVALGVLLVRYLATRQLRATLRRLEVERRLQDERERISQDLHDHVGAQLSTIVSGIDLARLASASPNQGDGAPAKAVSYLDRLEAHARTTMAQLRETIWALHHETVTLQAFHERLCTYARTQAGLRPSPPRIDCRLHAADPGWTLTPMQALNLYRIAQEAVENALKHAAAQHLTIDVQAATDALILVVEDDGAFAAPRTVGATVADDLRGFGLDGMQRRAERLGGRFAMDTAAGTTVRVEIPWAHEEPMRG
ncbi:MAG: two-component regulator propeller domain-containing protein [Bacteroidota bacterium]